MSVRRERWVSPPLVAREAPSASAARWRFRAFTGVLMAIVGVLVFLMFLKVAGVTSEDPGFGVGLRAAQTSLQTPQVAPAAG